MTTCLNWFNRVTYLGCLVLIGLIIIVILQVAQYYKDGVFKLLLPFKTLENNDRNRMAIALAFGSFSEFIISLVIFNSKVDISWTLKPFLIMIVFMLFALVAFPLLICIHSSHVRLSSLLGAGYLIAYLLILVLVRIQVDCLTTNGDKWIYVGALPDVICIVLVFAIFIKRLINGHKYPSFYYVLLAHQKKYVRRLWNPSQYLQNPGNFFERYLWNRDPCFRFPAVVLIPAIVSLIFGYKLLIGVLSSSFNVQKKIAAIITVVICVVQMFFFLKSFKKDFRNVLKHGQVGNNPYRMTKSEILIKYSLFPGYLVVFNIFGVLVIFASFLITFKIVDYAIKNPEYCEKAGIWTYNFMVSSIVVMIAQQLIARFVFIANVDKNDHMSVNHFNYYHFNMYWTIFLNLSIGFVSFFWTSIVSFLVNVLCLPRFDLLMMNPKYFARIYTGHQIYQATVTLEATFKNPTMRCFCFLLLETATYGKHYESDTSLNDIRPRLPNCLAKNRWFLAVTLMKNPSLAQYRKRKISENGDIDEQICI